jgi:hypothetical protein
VVVVCVSLPSASSFGQPALLLLLLVTYLFVPACLLNQSINTK